MAKLADTPLQSNRSLSERYQNPQKSPPKKINSSRERARDELPKYGIPANAGQSLIG